MRPLYKALTLFLFTSGQALAQSTFYQFDTTVKVYNGTAEKTLAWCGGFNTPQFSNADLNHDGLNDLVVFESVQGVATFINRGSAGNPDYRYAPEYALEFPPILGYLIMADYNCDGITDLFQKGNNGFTAYKGYYNSANHLCFSFYRELFYYNDAWSGGSANAYCNPGDVPAVADVDGDGDLDFVAYDITGGKMNYYKNLRVELGLPCDSIHIALKDRCWGKVYQGFYRTHVLGYTCDNSGLSKNGNKVTHSGNAICLFDWDMDGDMDYLDGSVSFNELSFLKNGRMEYGGNDSMVFQDTTWQTGGHAVHLPVWPAAYNVDVDQDGKRDLLIAPNSSNSENYKTVMYYKNLSSAGSPNWVFQSDSFLVDKIIDAGTASYPMLFDYDKDGKLDLFVGSDGYRQSSGLLAGKISYYRNTSNSGGASFTLQTMDFNNIGGYAYKGVAPAVGDVDNDGKTDLVIGHTDGTLSFFKNMAASNSVQPNWQLASVTMQDITGTDINVEGYATPFLYDIDKDGKADLVIGNTYGTLVYYQNVSTVAGTMKLKLINMSLGGAVADPNNVIGNYSTPFIGKIDNSGSDMLLMGSNSGNIYCFTGFQSGDTTATYTLVDGHYSYIDSTYNLYNHPGLPCGIYFNHRSSLTVGDIDGSGSYSMIVGNVRGGLEFYKRKFSVGLDAASGDNGRVNVYPNPARDVLNISWDGISGEEVSIELLTVTGQLCQGMHANAADKYVTMSLGNLAAGVYICQVRGAAGKYCSKVVIAR